MIITTTSSIEGKVPIAYFGIIGAEVIFGASFWKDWLAEGTDAWGGRSVLYEKVFEDARTTAVEIIEKKARDKGANAVLNVRFDYSVLGANNGMLMVAATGTAVVVKLNKEEEIRAAHREKENEEAYLVEVGGKLLGPLSVAQLRVLVAGGKITTDLPTVLEDNSLGPTVGDLVSIPASPL